LVQLINNVLLVQLSLRSSSHRCIINFGSWIYLSWVCRPNCVLT
jgi:hypothetical protein